MNIKLCDNRFFNIFEKLLVRLEFENKLEPLLLSCPFLLLLLRFVKFFWPRLVIETWNLVHTLRGFILSFFEKRIFWFDLQLVPVLNGLTWKWTFTYSRTISALGLVFNFLIDKKFDLFYWRSVLREIDQKNNWYIHNIILLLLLQEYQV